MRYENGVMETFENNNMSLSCHAEIFIKNNKIIDIHYKGFPRPCDEGWINIYKSFQYGQQITDDIIEKLLTYNGKCNVISIFSKY